MAPANFVRLKQWMSDLPDRDARKKRRDALQAAAILQVVREYLPQYDVSLAP